MAEIFEELLIKLKGDLETARRQEAENRLSIYNDAWLDILDAEMDNQFNEKTRGDVKQMPAIDQNVLKRIVNEVSVVYQSPANRAFIIGEGDTAKEDENYNDLMNAIPINLTMEKTNRMTNLINESLIYIVPRNDRIEYDILTSDLVEVYQNPENSKDVEAICFTQTLVDTKGTATIYYIYWDVAGKHLKFDADFEPVSIEGNPNDENPYKDPNNKGRTILPFVIFHKDFPINTVWNPTLGGDVVSNTKQVGVLLTYLNYLYKTQSFKQKYFTGVNVKDVLKDLVNDPLWNIVINSPDGKVGVLDYQVAIDTLWEIIMAKIGAVANNYGMSLDNFKLVGAPESGYALKIKNLPLEKIVEGQIKLYRWHEKDLAEKTRIINNYQFKNAKINEKAVFKIDFAEPVYPENPEDTRKQWTFDIQMGAKSAADYSIAVNPDLKSEKEAIESIKKNMKTNALIEEETGQDIGAILNKAFATDEGAQNNE